MIKTIFAQETAQDLRAQWKGVSDALRDRAPRLAELMDAARDDVLAYTAFPKDHWPQIASTNPLERLNKEIKRRARGPSLTSANRATACCTIGSRQAGAPGSPAPGAPKKPPGQRAPICQPPIGKLGRSRPAGRRAPNANRSGRGLWPLRP